MQRAAIAVSKQEETLNRNGRNGKIRKVVEQLQCYEGATASSCQTVLLIMMSNDSRMEQELFFAWEFHVQHLHTSF